MPDLADVTSAVLGALGDTGLPYALAGGLSANAWVAPEHQAPTFDVDVAVLVPDEVEFDLDAFAGVVKARLGDDCLYSASLAFPKARIERFLCGDVVVDIVLAPARYAAAALARVGTTVVQGTTHPILDPNDVVLYKALGRREKDIGILLALKKDQRLSKRYVESWARALGVWRFVKKILWPPR